jgi:bacterioferritin (cytochrome b1)
MKCDPKVMAGLQEAINLEASLMLQYLLDQRNVKRFGLSLADGLKNLHEQCEGYMKDLASAVLFFDGGAPEFAPWRAVTHTSVTTIQAAAIAAEQTLVTRYVDLCKQAGEAGEMDVFHLYQHLIKWHRRGGNGNEGHLAWLQKQNWQLAEFGEKDYEAVKA